MNLIYFPVYFGITIRAFEGNAIILNLYAEVDKPKTFIK